MNWYIAGDVQAGGHWEVVVSDSWLVRAQAEAPDNAVLARIDPYGDTTLDRTDLLTLLEGLEALQVQSREAMMSEVIRSGRLPRDPEVRAKLVASLVDKRLAAEPFQKSLDDLFILVELAIETGTAVHIIGD